MGTARTTLPKSTCNKQASLSKDTTEIEGSTALLPGLNTDRGPVDALPRLFGANNELASPKVEFFTIHDIFAEVVRESL
jgi:hypothetical protein